MSARKRSLVFVALILLVSMLPLGVHAQPAAPATVDSVDAVPGPLATWPPPDLDPILQWAAPQVGAHGLDTYAPPQAGEPTWERWPYGSPDQTFGYLEDVQWTPAASGAPVQAWAVGLSLETYRGLAMYWDGTAWVRTSVPVGAGSITQVAPLSATDVWAAGNSFIHWDGSAWSIVDLLPSNDVVLTLQMLSPTLGFAGTFRGYLYTWDGTKWTAGEKISPTDVQGIHMFDAQHGWAIGQQGVLLRCQGGTWAQVYSPVSRSFLGIDFVTPNDGWIVGTGGTFLHWDGRAWQPVTVPEATATLAVAMHSANDGWAVGELGKVFRWDGQRWSRMQVADVENILLTSVASASSASAFMVGSNGTVQRWDGRAWTPVLLYNKTPVSLHAVQMTAANDGWAAGAGGNMVRWNGRNWETQDPAPSTVNAIDALSSQSIWMGGDGFIAHGDGIADWVVDDVQAIIMSVDCVPPEAVFAAGFTAESKGVIYKYDGANGWQEMPVPANTPSLVGIKMYSANVGFAVGVEGTILRWDSGAGQWVEMESPVSTSLYSVEFVSLTEWWAVGARGTILRGDGTSWTLVESPLPNHLLRTVRLNNDKYSTDDELWIGGELGAFLHYDRDAGAWEVVPSNTANMIYGIGGLPLGDLWAVGEFGTILRYGATYTVAGRVTGALSGAGLPDLAVRADTAFNSSATVQTDANGDYTFTGVLPDTYTVTVATPGYAITPTAQVVVVPPSATAVDFTASRPLSWKCWPFDEPFACTPNLNAVKAAGDGTAWAVGDGGAIFFWDGTRWLRFASPTRNTLNGLAVRTATDAWAAGLKGTVLHWDGMAWRLVETGDATDLGGVAALAADDVWVAGRNGMMRHWNGATWQTYPTGTTDTLLTIAMLTATDGWAAGGNVSLAGTNSTILHWNGQAWSQVFSPAEKPLMGLSMVSPVLGWAAGLDGIFRWNGSYWAFDPAAERNVYSGITMHSATDGWATGFKAGYPVVAHWDGQSWTVSQLESDDMATGVTYLSAQEQLLVGQVSLTGRRQGDGNWRVQTPALGDVGTSVDALTAGDVWMGTMAGKVWRWDGTQWHEHSNTSTSSGGHNVIRAYADDDVWLGGYDGYVGHWDGTQWTNLGEPTDKFLNQVSEIGPNDVWAAGGRFVKQGSAIIPTPELMHWNGTTWSRPDLGGLQTIFSGMVDFGPNNIWVSGYGGVMMHYDGTNWSTEHTGGDQDYILALAALAPDNIWGVGVGGQIIHYDGTGWQTMGSPTQEQLGDLQLLADGTGWAVGWDILYFDGQEWRLEASPTERLLLSVALILDHDGWAVGAEGVKLRLGPSYIARGQVTDVRGDPVSGVEITSNQGMGAFTDMDGSFAFDDLGAGTITITPVSRGWVFDPPSRTFTTSLAAAGLNGAAPAAVELGFTAHRVYRSFMPEVTK